MCLTGCTYTRTVLYMTTTTKTQAQTIATDALEMATDYGTRTWMREPKLTDNAFDGSDIRHGDITYRLTMDDNTVRLFVFVGGNAMLLKDEASFTSGMAFIAADYIAEAMR